MTKVHRTCVHVFNSNCPGLRGRTTTGLVYARDCKHYKAASTGPEKRISRKSKSCTLDYRIFICEVEVVRRNSREYPTLVIEANSGEAATCKLQKYLRETYPGYEAYWVSKWYHPKALIR